MRSYYEFWAKRIIKDGLKSIKNIIGIGLAFILGYSVNIQTGILFFSWVLIESLIEKN